VDLWPASTPYWCPRRTRLPSGVHHGKNLSSVFANGGLWNVLHCFFYYCYSVNSSIAMKIGLRYGWAGSYIRPRFGYGNPTNGMSPFHRWIVGASSCLQYPVHLHIITLKAKLHCNPPLVAASLGFLISHL
jgi:hypothetical protein